MQEGAGGTVLRIATHLFLKMGIQSQRNRTREEGAGSRDPLETQ